MSVSGSSGAARRAVHEFDEALDAASEPDTTSKAKVSKTEMREALKELSPVRGHMSAKTRADVWAKINEHALTPTAKKLAEATIGPAPATGPALPTDGPKLAKHLATLAKDLTFMSESDYPFKAFSKPLSPSKPATDAELRKAFGLPAGTPISKRDAKEWFTEQQDPDRGFDAANQAQWKALEQAYKAGLKDVSLVYTQTDDVVEAKVYLVGRAPEGSITGLSSTRIWT